VKATRENVGAVKAGVDCCVNDHCFFVALVYVLYVKFLFQDFTKIFTYYSSVVMSSSVCGSMSEEDYQRYLGRAKSIARSKVQELAMSKAGGLVLDRASQSATRSVDADQFVEEANAAIAAALKKSDNVRHINAWIWFPEGKMYCIEGRNLIDIKVFMKEGRRIVTLSDYVVELKVRKKDYKA